MKHWLRGLVIGLSLSLFSTATAWACPPPPPPDWEMWVGNEKTHIFVGRVISGEAMPDRTELGARFRSATFRIQHLETIQGSPGADVVELIADIEILDAGGRGEGSLCPVATHQSGDIVLVVEPDGWDRPFVYSRGWVSRTSFAAFLERHE